jgi:chemotaxis protein methyltransferase CheR
VNTAIFQQFSEIAYRRAGIRLGPGKEALVGARISKRMRALGLQTPTDYLEYLLADDSGEEVVNFLDVISTNFTHFFRESEHFELLAQHVRKHITANRSRLRFWSAACSSGEEPYTMALTIADTIGEANINWRILATDISTRVLEKASNATYDDYALRNVPRHIKSKYFHVVEPKSSTNARYRVGDQLRRFVTFKRLNLSSPPFPMRGPIDFIMCRNVMIYFDQHVRQGLISSIESLLAPDGILCIGHAETLNGLKTGLRAVQPSVYVHSSSTLRPTKNNNSIRVDSL